MAFVERSTLRFLKGRNPFRPLDGILFFSALTLFLISFPPPPPRRLNYQPTEKRYSSMPSVSR